MKKFSIHLRSAADFDSLSGIWIYLQWREGDVFSYPTDVLIRDNEFICFWKCEEHYSSIDECIKKTKTYYMVYLEWGNPPKHFHYSMKSAEKEAKRLAEKTGKKAFVMKGVKSFEAQKLIEKIY